MIRIRRARDEQSVDAVKGLAAELFVSEFDTGGHALWLGMDADRAVCFGAAKAHRHGRDWGGYLTLCGVLPEYRGQGLQRRLIEARTGWAIGEGMSTVWTYTAPDNAASMTNLIRCGFTPWAPGSFDRSEPGSWVYWRRVTL